MKHSFYCILLITSLEEKRTKKPPKFAACSQNKCHLVKSNNAKESGKTFIPPLTDSVFDD